MTRRVGAAVCVAVLCMAGLTLDGPALAEEDEKPETSHSADQSKESRPAKEAREAAKDSRPPEVTGLPVFVPEREAAKVPDLREISRS